MSVYHLVQVLWTDNGWEARCSECAYVSTSTLSWNAAEYDALAHERQSAEVPS